MTDAEKREVIKELEESYQQYLVVEGQGILVDHAGNEYALIDPVLIKDAIALLKAQEPVNPVPAIDDVGDWLCGNCYQSVVGDEELDASGFVPIKFNFCPNCGRAVKWE